MEGYPRYEASSKQVVLVQGEDQVGIVVATARDHGAALMIAAALNYVFEALWG